LTGDPAPVAKIRSLMNLSMIGALGNVQKLELHLNGVASNGWTAAQCAAIDCDAAQALEGFAASQTF